MVSLSDVQRRPPFPCSGPMAHEVHETMAGPATAFLIKT